MQTLDRQLKALELRKAGMGYRRIADELGYKGASGAFGAVEKGLRAALREPAEELITLELERLDQMYYSIALRIRDGDLQAIGMGLRIAERRARLLGLDKAPGIGIAMFDGDAIILSVNIGDNVPIDPSEYPPLEDDIDYGIEDMPALEKGDPE